MAQKIIIFEDILNGDALLESKEIKALSNHQLGGSSLSLGETDKAEEFHDWLGDELLKSINGGYGQMYRMKAPWGDLKGKNESSEYSGPVNVHLFEPDAAVDDGILLLTCNWKGSIFSNDHYVCGVVANADDLERMLDSKVGGKLIGGEEEENPAKKEELPVPKKMTTKEVIKHLNNLTQRVDRVESFDELQDVDDEERDFWNGLDEKTQKLKTVIAAHEKYFNKSLIMSFVLANR